ncbi:hypothetical protein UA08_03330 [Talaromyces atroroseus]|uniref:Major facilitator superfamily (MFS) profile domain-containing protein n=1 Tax=Talaromyces atroroseus TaxID=1441469 RepID=A0A225AW16_TALAT|nr:hypothetical protein UA08_03330 [Talaromyces atroroseus]OKL61498.1 hypothetical protein UA08_03330 [Talaromyces atroroseus]
MAPPGRKWSQRAKVLSTDSSETSPLLEVQFTTEFSDMANPNPKSPSVPVSEQHKQYDAGVAISSNESAEYDDDDDNSNKGNPFLDPDVAEYWRFTYEKSQYECRHVFDPTLTWSEEEEKRIIRKLDWRVCLWACVMFFGLQVDRSNLTQAVSGTFLHDLKLNTNDYNWGNTVFKVSFLLAELPSQLVSKKIGPDRWIPMQIALWSIVAICQCAITDRGSFLATRALLGILEGGFIPDIVLWLSYFYTSRELPIRLSFFWATLSVTSIVTSLLAFAIFHLNGVHGLAGWRWLFLIEGVITLAIGLGSFFMMPASAVQTKTWFRPKGWFNDRELAIVVNRVLRDDPSKGDMHNRQAITPTRLWNAATDYHLWPVYLIGFLAYIPQTPPSTYLTLTLRSVGFSTFNTNLLTIPSTIVVGWTSRNSNNVGTRSVSAALYNMAVQLGSIVANFIYRDDDRPMYHRGNTDLIAINIVVIFIFLGTKVYYLYQNRRRDRIWNTMTEGERSDYIKYTKVQGSRRLDFRFAH